MAEPIIGGDPATSPKARERAEAMVGRVVSDRYRIVELVAMGGMGAIFRAEHLLMHKHVAIKLLHPEIEGFPELVARFEREAVAGAHVQHPNVAAASDMGKFDGDSCFLVLEYIEGTTLREVLNQGPVAPARAAAIARQLAAALGAVHEKEIVHRDVKPLNVMLLKPPKAAEGEPEELVKLIDFGLAKVPIDKLSALARDGDPIRRSLTAAGVVMGTVAYIAPEAALGMRSVGPRSDLYSLGVLFYEMLAGKHPFDGDDAKTLFSQHRSNTPPPISERTPGVVVPPELEAVVMKLLEKDPDARYANAEALIEAIDAAIPPPQGKLSLRAPPKELTPVAVSRPPPSSRPPPPMRSNKVLWIAAAAAGVVGLVVILAVTMSGSTAQPQASSSATTTAPPESTEETALPPRSSAAPVVAKSAREKLRAAVDALDPGIAGAILLEVIEKDAGAFRDRAVQTEAAEAATLAAKIEAPSVDEVFDKLATKLGADGLDILYDIVAKETASADPAERVGVTKPKSGPARAKALLARPDFAAKGTPAMRIAMDLRRVPCSQRPGLFARAAKDGDDRALQLLTSMQPPACSRETTSCCFPQHRQLDRTVAEIQARLRR